MYNFIDNNGSQIHKINRFNLYIVFEIKYANKCDIFFIQNWINQKKNCELFYVLNGQTVF